MAWLTDARLDRARELLETTAEPVEKIGRLTGLGAPASPSARAGHLPAGHPDGDDVGGCGEPHDLLEDGCVVIDSGPDPKSAGGPVTVRSGPSAEVDREGVEHASRFEQAAGDIQEVGPTYRRQIKRSNGVQA
jgi:hypothetical protein